MRWVVLLLTELSGDFEHSLPAICPLVASEYGRFPGAANSASLGTSKLFHDRPPPHREDIAYTMADVKPEHGRD